MKIKTNFYGKIKLLSLTRLILAAFGLQCILLLNSCSTCEQASVVIPPPRHVIEELIKRHETVLGIRVASSVEVVEVSLFDVNGRYWPVKAVVRYAGLFSVTKWYKMYKDTQGLWAVSNLEKREP